jgi:formylmethanofuran dehydrogenase subunit E
MKEFDALLEEAIAFHGHRCPGQVLGVRMALAGCRALGIDEPRAMGKRLVVFVELDRCATDAIATVTGCSLGKRTLKHIDYGKMAATFALSPDGRAVRVVARDESRERAAHYAPAVDDRRQAQAIAYRVMPETELLRIEPVTIRPGWLDRKRQRVRCERCGEGVNYQREVVAGGITLCRACHDGAYYLPERNGIA